MGAEVDEVDAGGGGGAGVIGAVPRAFEGAGCEVLAGDDAFICPTVLMGGHGAIAAASHLCTPRFVAMVAAALDRDVVRAVELAESLLPVVRAGFSEPSPAVWKGALERLGEIAHASLRRPMTTASSLTPNR